MDRAHGTAAEAASKAASDGGSASDGRSRGVPAQGVPCAQPAQGLRLGLLRVPSVVAALVAAVLASLVGTTARGDGQLQDFVRLRGHETDVLVGMGLVVGLDGTGDSMKDSTIAGQPYAQLVKTLGNIAATQRDLNKFKSVAVVMVRAEVPEGGARVGDRLNVRVSILGNAKSIKGGELVSTFLLPDVVPADRSTWIAHAIAEGGPIETGELETSGIVRNGARVVRDIVKNPFDGASVALVLKPEYVGIPTATAIAEEINQELVNQDFSGVAVVEDATTIRIRIPEGDPQAKPHQFISSLLTLSMSAAQLRLPGRIVIDKRNKVIAIDESVEFRAVAISVDTLRITTLTPPPQPTPDNPLIESTSWVGVATGRNRDGEKLGELIEMLKQLDVPFESQVAVIENLKSIGAITAEIVTP
jgi:flagellar P-ring protein precursor FlgI